MSATGSPPAADAGTPQPAGTGDPAPGPGVPGPAQSRPSGRDPDALFAELYSELHRIAARQLRRNGGSTLGATTLIHEAYVDMSGRAADFPDRARFFAYAARAMRGVVIDYARERHAQKRGGEYHLTALDTEVAGDVAAVEGMERLADALGELERVDAPLAELVDLKFFCGFTFAEIAAQRGVSERTVQRDWQKARLFLHDLLAPE
jgi:RNA polymerase sigma factor (TIGR02999 family)